MIGMTQPRMSASTAEAPATTLPTPASPWLVPVNYLLPGAGFCVAGRWSRGLIQATTVLLTVALGLLLHGGVVWPSWTPQAQDFNLINNLTFLVQLGGGLPCLASLAANVLDWPILAGRPENAYYELGSYYLVVAGAINYFATMNFYDRLVRLDARFREQETDGGEGGL
jgi:hypothetical protein